jgi:outer membrane protein assembly factor BamB
VVADESIPLNWSASENLSWIAEIPGSGWSQPVVCQGRVFVTAAVSEKDLRPKNFSEGVKSPRSMGLSLFAKAPDVTIQWQTFCLEATTGSVLWRQTVHSGKPKYAIHPSNSFATESPVADENGVYVYFGACGTVAALSRDGEQRWSKNVGVFKTSNSFGTGSSLAIYEGKVYAQNLSEGSARIVCFDTRTGNVVWEAKRDKKETSWSTPLIWNNAERTELIVSGGNRVDSYDPETGDRLWTVGNVKAATACSPCADRSRLYFGSSDPFSKGPLFAVSIGGSGELTPEARNTSFPNCAWLADRAGPGMASPVSSGDLVYVVDSSVLKCYDAATGQRVYQNRLPKMRMVAASPLIVGDQLLVIDENGTACVVALGRDFHVVGTGKLDDTFWATPAVADSTIYLRGVNALYCIRDSGAP